MKNKPRAVTILLGVLATVGLLYVSPSAAQDAQKIERLERLIQQQQQQLESMRRELNQLKQTAEEAKSTAEKAKSDANDATTAVQATIGKKNEFRNLISSSPGNIKLAISGQVNRAVNVIDDGKNTDAYFVDNDASNSRVRFIGTAQASDDLTIGSRIEVAFAPNESSRVNQNDEDNGNLNSGDNFIDDRWAEVSLLSKRFGKVSLGKGDTASNNSAEVDFSKVDVVDYASIADIAGGMYFRQSSGDNSLTNVTVSDAFNDRDGLSRKNRVRYDTPTFYGFSLAGSLVSNQRWDGSIWWGGQGLGFKAAAAAAISNPNQDNTDLQYDGSFSLLHEATGLNFTVSAGLLDRTDEGDPTNLYFKSGWLTRLFSVGQTAFAIDYTRSVNLPTGRDDGHSYAGTVNQIFQDYGTELYMQYRVYSLNREVAPSVEDMYVGTIGTRVKF